MKSIKYEYWVRVNEIIPPLGMKKFAATVEIHEIGKGKIEHNLGEVWGETREEAHDKMETIARQWVQVNEK
jgi:hypothetical protein